MGILLGLLAATAYGAADFCAGLATRRTSMFAVAIVTQAVGFVLLFALLPFFHGSVTQLDYLWGILAGFCLGIGLALLYRALAIGKMGVVSPITAVVAAAIPVYAGALRGEHLSMWQLLGILVALVAIVLIALSRDENGRIELKAAGVKEALGSGVMLGGFYVLLALSGKHAGLYPIVMARGSATVLLLVLAFFARGDVRPTNGTLPLVLLAGVIDVSANVLYLLATFAGFLSIAAVLTSLYPASTVFLARIVLRERLQTSQKIGVALALAGVALIAI